MKVKNARPVRAGGLKEVMESDRIAFTQGSCHQLAIAIHKETDWPVCAFKDNWSGSWDVHAVVKTPGGRYLDIEGLHTRNSLFRKWIREDSTFSDSGYGLQVVKNPEKALADWDFGNPYFDSMARAKELVPVLLKEYVLVV